MTKWTAAQTIAATKETAEATIRATLDAAQLEVRAAQAQMDQQRQLAHRQRFSELVGFFAMVSGAMDVLLEDCNKARGEINRFRELGFGTVWQNWCLSLETLISRVGFADIRPAFVRYGGSLANVFLTLDRDIEQVARISRIQPDVALPSPEKIEALLSKIETVAAGLKQEALAGWRENSSKLAGFDD